MEKVINENKITAFIVAYHEEKVIGRCLNSLVDAVDEIILIHDGPCKDNTLNIGKKYADKIFEMPVNKGIGESHYIFALKQCSYNWILRIDADEYLSDELRNNIKELAKHDDVAAYSFIWPLWNGNKYITKGWPYKNFIFQKNKIGFLDKFHYPIVVKGILKREKFIIHHKPFYNNFTKETFENKTIKWCKLQAKDHLVPIEDREIYNLDVNFLKKEQEKKSKFYRYPKVCGIISFLSYFSNALKTPYIIIQKGFWLGCILLSKYTYNVAKEVCLLKKQSKYIKN